MRRLRILIIDLANKNVNVQVAAGAPSWSKMTEITAFCGEMPLPFTEISEILLMRCTDSAQALLRNEEGIAVVR